MRTLKKKGSIARCVRRKKKRKELSPRKRGKKRGAETALCFLPKKKIFVGLSGEKLPWRREKKGKERVPNYVAEQTGRGKKPCPPAQVVGGR